MMPRLIAAALLLGAVQTAGAELIDDYSASQGPLTVGPGEEISEEEGILQTPSVLGGFRVLVPGLDEDAPGGSSVTASVAGGEFMCDIDLPAGSDSGGGCGSAYDRGDGPLFDLTGSNAFELDISAASGSAMLQVAVFGPDNNSAAAFIQMPTAGDVTLPFSQFAPLTPTPVDWAAVDTIVLTIASGGGGGRIDIDRFGTDGPIANGEAVPGDDPDDDDLPSDAELRHKVYGNYYNPQRSGEGIQLTLEADGQTFILTYYTYLDGEQVWLIGTGRLVDGKIRFEDVSITEGADYGPDFDENDVVATFWGEIEMDFIDCNSAVLEISPQMSGFQPFIVQMQRIVPTNCAAGPPPPGMMQITGNWYDPDRSGEGFQLAFEEGRYILTFYTYRNGEQVWMIGVGDRDGNTLSFPEVYVTEGGDFGGRFRAEDVTNIFFGEIEMITDGCNTATVEINASLPGFSDQTLQVQKIVPAGICLS
jgi:hypothetical protein